MINLWTLGIRNLLRNRRRTIATGLSIAVGFAGLMFTFGYVIRVEHYLSTMQIYLLNSGHLAIYKEQGLLKSITNPDLYSFTTEEQQTIAQELKSDGEVAYYTPYLIASGLLNNGCKSVPYRAVGVAPASAAWIRQQPPVLENTPEVARLLRGRGLWEFPALDGAIMVSENLAHIAGKPLIHDEVKTGSSVGDLLDCQASDVKSRIAQDANVQLLSGTFSGSFAVLDAEIVGVFNPGFTEFEDTALITSLKTLQTLHDTDVVTYMAVFLKDPHHIERAAKVLEDRLKSKGLAVTVYAWNDTRTSPQYVSAAQMLQILGIFILVIMATVVALSIANSMTISVIERRREFGMLRALGFTRGRVMRMLLIEVLMLTLLGGLAGLAGGWITASLVNLANIRFKPPGVSGAMQFMVTPTVELCLLLGVLMTLMALGTTLVTAHRSLRQKIVGLLYAP